MSEHLAVEGKIEYYHLPYNEPGAFTYCNRCKKTLSKLIVEFHEGIISDWTKVICPKCNKTIWVAGLTSENKDGTFSKERKIVKDDKKCSVCKKPTNKYDCNCISYCKGRIKIICSDKCYKKNEGKK